MANNLDKPNDVTKKALLPLELYSINDFNEKFDLNIKKESNLDDFVDVLNSSGIFQCTSAAENKDASVPTPMFVEEAEKETYKHLQVDNFVTVVKVK